MRFLIICIFLICTANAHAKVIDRVLAVVNDRMVTQSDLTDFQNDLKNKGLVDSALLAFYDVKSIQSNPSAALNYLIDTKIIDSVIDKLGIQVPIEDVEAEIRNIARKSNLSKQQLMDGLKKRGVRYSDYQDFVKTSIERQNLLKKEISSKIKISDEDIANFYIQKRNNSDALVFEYELAHIFFQPKENKSKSPSERANEVLNKLKSGESFNVLASKYSEDPRFSQGGLFGVVKAGDIVPELEKALKGLKEGDTTGIVKMSNGFHIFKVLDRKLVASDDFEREKRFIADKLFSEVFFRQYGTWMQEQRKSAFLKVHAKK